MLLNMKKKNKEIIEELTKYFMKQPQEHTCELLACMIIDLNRIVNSKELEKSELESLKLRIQWNIDQINYFIKNGTANYLKLETINSDDNI